METIRMTGMKWTFSRLLVGYLSAVVSTATLATAAPDPTFPSFNFGNHSLSGAVFVSPANVYSPATGYGFEPAANVRTTNGCICSDSPFYFSVNLPEGNYRVTVTLGNKYETSATTIKAEVRRLAIYHIQTAKGGFVTRKFIVNVHQPEIAGDGEVQLKSSEKTEGWWDWDDKLTLEFNDTRPSIRTLTIEKVNVPTIYILGDSTVCDQPFEPWNSWGQMLPVFFKPSIAVANYAVSGGTIADALASDRFKKILSQMKFGDYLFFQFGQIDIKSKKPDALEQYKADLKKVVEETIAQGGTPVLVTSMERKTGVEHPTLEGYPDAVRETARQEHCALIDLNAMSVVFYKALGTNLDKAFVEGPHHSNYGSYELAKCVMQGIDQTRLPLVSHISSDFKGFDPAHPDPVDTFYMPASPRQSVAKSEGN